MPDPTQDPQSAPTPTTNLTGAGVDQPIQPNFTSMLAGAVNAPQPAPPTPPTPITAPQGTLMSNLLRGALLGAAGGLKGGLEDVAAAGQRPTRGMGMAYGEQEAQQFQQQQAQKLAAANAQQQQAFENQKSSFEMSATQQRDRAMNLQSLMNAYKAAQEMDAAPQERQDKYFAGQEVLKDKYEEQGLQGKTFDSLAAFTQWHAANPTADIQTVHLRTADGKDQIVVYPLTGGQVSTDSVNAQLKAVGSDQILPTGQMMDNRQAHALVQNASAKAADQVAAERLERTRLQGQAALEGQREGFEAGQETRRETHEETMETLKAAGKPPAFLNAIKPIDAAYTKTVQGSTDQIAKIDSAKQLVTGPQAGQGLAPAKVLTALVSGQGSGVRITMPELQMLIKARGINESAEAWLSHISGQSEFPADQQRQIVDVLDAAKDRILQKQMLANDHLTKLRTSSVTPGSTLKDAYDVDADYRQRNLDMETGKIPVASPQHPAYRVSPDGKQKAVSYDGINWATAQ